MSDENGKIKLPDDLANDLPAGPERDPEVLAEIKKNKILHLRLERWKETAGAMGVVFQTFKAEAMSLTSGIGTLVLGWFQIKKVVVRGRAETKAEGRMEGWAKGRIAGRAAERAERREDRHEKPLAVEAMSPPPPPGGELVAEPMNITASMSPYLDPMNYATILVPVVFIWSSVIAWLKRKRKNQNKEAGNV